MLLVAAALGRYNHIIFMYIYQSILYLQWLIIVVVVLLVAAAVGSRRSCSILVVVGY